MTRSAGWPAPAPRAGEAKPRHRGRWQTAKRWLVPAFAVLVVAMLVSHAHKVDWDGAWEALQSYRASTLAVAVALAAASYFVFGGYDVLGKYYVGHALSLPRIWATAFVCYAFNLNLGSLVGSIGLRIKLYASHGLAPGEIGRVLGFSLLTNWLGYCALAGTLFVTGAVAFPDDAPIHGGALRALGAVLVLAVAAYLGACLVSRRREWTVRGHRLVLPKARLALLQLLLSTVNWSLMAFIIHYLLGGAVGYPVVLGVLLAAAIAGVATHVPAGLGVLEAVFIALMDGLVPQGRLLGALLAYRAIYYLAPLAIAIVVYFVLDRMARRARAS